MSQYGGICCRHWEWHFSQSRVQRLDSNDSIPLLRKAEGTKKAFYLEIRVGRPNSDVITMLVRYTGPLDVEFHVNTIPVMGNLEQLARHRNRRSIRVLCVMNTLRSGEGACRQLAWNESVNKATFNGGEGRQHTAVDLLRCDGVLNLGHSKVRGVTTLAFFHVHDTGECFPHAILPFEVILFHALIVIALTAVTDPGGTHLGKVFIDLLRDNVIMLVRLVAEAEDNILETVELMFTLAELERLVREVLHKLYSVVGRFAFTVGRHHENCSTILGKLVQVFKVIFFRVADEGSETELGLGFLSDTNSVLLGCPSL